MKERIVQEAVDRIEEMEQCFDTLVNAVDTDPDSVWEDASLKELLQNLIAYYEGGLWLSDYELDEQGLLPEGMKRGVLAQDAVYDFLTGIQSVLPPETQNSATEK